tara:strand:- start:867 stop:1250 length:384 start_codon:yes stop_codon:yes gene_type:complete
MNLSQLVNFLENNQMPSNADFFKSCANDSVTVDGLIEADFVKRHLVIEPETERSTKLWREVQANVTTYIGCDNFKFRVSDRNDVGIWGEVYDSNGKYVKSMNIPYKEWASKYGILFHEAYLRTFDLK